MGGKIENIQNIQNIQISGTEESNAIIVNGTTYITRKLTYGEREQLCIYLRQYVKQKLFSPPLDKKEKIDKDLVKYAYTFEDKVIMGGDINTKKEILSALADKAPTMYDPDQKIRIAVAGNKNLPSDVYMKLLNDPTINPNVAKALAKNTNAPEEGLRNIIDKGNYDADTKKLAKKNLEDRKKA